MPPQAPAGTRPRPEYDPASVSLTRREQAKAVELTAAGRPGTASAITKRRRYEVHGVIGMVDHRIGKRTPPHGRADPAAVEAMRKALTRRRMRPLGPRPTCSGEPVRSWTPPTAAHQQEPHPLVLEGLSVCGQSGTHSSSPHTPHSPASHPDQTLRRGDLRAMRRPAGPQPPRAPAPMVLENLPPDA